MIQKLKSNIWFQRISNKYVLSSVVFCVWMFFLDTHSVLIQSMRSELSELESNPKAFEKYAREKFWMHKPGEKIVLIEIPQED